MIKPLLIIIHTILAVPITTIHPIAHDQCPEEMNQVKADYCPTISQRCEKWSDDLGIKRCLHFAPSVCLSKKITKNFCVDTTLFTIDEQKYEEESFSHAKDICAANNKRLCSVDELTLACEGPNALPYPTGFDRPASECAYTEKDVPNKYPRCISSFGVMHSVGTHNEWTAEGKLKGGFGFTKRSQCRATYIIRNAAKREDAKNMFRCCQDIK
jgi:hypothetical protein